MEKGKQGLGFVSAPYLRSLDPIYQAACRLRRELRDQQYAIFHASPMPDDWESRVDRIETQIGQIAFA